MRFIIPLIVVSVLILTFSNNSLTQNDDKFAVVLGEKNWNERKEAKPNNCLALTIRLDGEGNYYPNIFISDENMKKSDGKLSIWYDKNPAEFKSLGDKYNINTDSLSLNYLNNSIEQRFTKLIDSLSIDKQIVFLIHGYRKQMYDQKDNVLSTVNNDSVETKLGQNKLFVEVYWDSKYITKFKSIIGKRGFKLMETSATANAKNVGIQLRSLVSSMKNPEIAIITHSLGAIVGNKLTFAYDSNSNLMEDKLIKIAYLGPAIGHESFKKSALRGKANYDLKTCIAYNEDDFVLQKEFGKFGIYVDSDATTYGNTSLGCNYNNDIDKLLNMYLEKMPNENAPVIVNMSGEKIHHFPNYAGHTNFTKVYDFLFE